MTVDNEKDPNAENGGLERLPSTEGEHSSPPMHEEGGSMEGEHSISLLHEEGAGMEGGLSSPPLPPTDDDSSSPFFQRGAEIEIQHNRLPHWQQGDVWCFVTWRLGDSLPAVLLRQWQEEKDAWLKRHPRPWDMLVEREYYVLFMERIDGWLDKGMGSCVLRDPGNAEIVAGALHHFDGERCDVASFVVMPNHVHVLFRPLDKNKLRAILQSWKGFTAREINKRLGQKGALWQEDYWDRLVRSYEHFEYYFGYIKENPSKAGLKPGEFLYFEKEKS